ncbi:MAG TPA: Arm DNA-binding domain-containing protein [Pseudorhodoferax sp.]|nr:Arm DNA-binding domain-containing protein [Pseudorhodoferax sp.]
MKDSGAKSWILRTTIAARRVEMGLGGHPSFALTAPRERRAKVEWTFPRTAEASIAAHKAGWKSDKHRAPWESTLAAYVHPRIGTEHVRDVTRTDVLAIIEPHGSTKNETMLRVRSRIELVLSYAMQREYRPEGPNPARWRGNLDSALPKPSNVAEVEHFEALPIDDMPGFMQRLRCVAGTSARALEFSILTATICAVQHGTQLGSALGGAV